MTKLASRIWHAPGGMWRGMMAAAPFRQWSQSGAAFALTLFAAGIVLILWRGPWSLAVEAKRVDGLVMICLCVLGIILVAIVAMNGVSLRLKASREGVDGAVGTDDLPAAAVTTTTTTTVQPPPSPPSSAA